MKYLILLLVGIGLAGCTKPIHVQEGDCYTVTNPKTKEHLGVYIVKIQAGKVLIGLIDRDNGNTAAAVAAESGLNSDLAKAKATKTSCADAGSKFVK